jgi:hypothetical protein
MSYSFQTSCPTVVPGRRVECLTMSVELGSWVCVMSVAFVETSLHVHFLCQIGIHSSAAEMAVGLNLPPLQTSIRSFRILRSVFHRKSTASGQRSRWWALSDRLWCGKPSGSVGETAATVCCPRKFPKKPIWNSAFGEPSIPPDRARNLLGKGL